MSTPPRWLYLGDCVWFGPECLRSKRRLAPYYQKSECFFRNILGIQDATSEMVLCELLSVTEKFQSDSSSNTLTTDSTRSMMEYLTALKRSYASAEDIERLQIARVWPCRLTKDARCTWVRSTDVFFIPDHARFVEQLDHKIPMLMLTISEVNQLMPLIIRLGMGTKLLSRSVETTTGAKDDSMLDKGLTDDLRKRSSFLLRYVIISASYDLWN
jgi:hypothetical protein